jgi:hypothetical protein
MLMGRFFRRPTETFLQEIVDVLNPGADCSSNLVQSSPFLAAAFVAAEFVACQGLSKDHYERCISGEVNNVSLSLDTAGNRAMDYVKSGKSLPGTGDACKEEQISLA